MKKFFGIWEADALKQMDQEKKEKPEHTGTTLGGHVSHMGGCWVMILTTLALLAVIFFKFC